MGIALIKFTDLGYKIEGLDAIFNSTKAKTTTLQTPIYLSPERLKQIMINKKNNNLISKDAGNQTSLRMKWLKERIDRISKKVQKAEPLHVEVTHKINPNYNVHIFYYAWYENVAVDGKWEHWNHQYLENWKKEDRKIYPTGSHQPPYDIGSNYFPSLGCYSSRDPNIIDTHMNLIRDAGIGNVFFLKFRPIRPTESFSEFVYYSLYEQIFIFISLSVEELVLVQISATQNDQMISRNKIMKGDFFTHVLGIKYILSDRLQTKEYLEIPLNRSTAFKFIAFSIIFPYFLHCV